MKIYVVMERSAVVGDSVLKAYRSEKEAREAMKEVDEWNWYIKEIELI